MQFAEELMGDESLDTIPASPASSTKSSGGGKRATKQKHRCPQCPAQCYSDAELRRHLTHHGCEEKYRCRFCNFSSAHAHVLPRHESVHLKAEVPSPTTEPEAQMLSPCVEETADFSQHLIANPQRSVPSRAKRPASESLATPMAPFSSQKTMKIVANNGCADETSICSQIFRVPKQCMHRGKNGARIYQCDRCPLRKYSLEEFTSHYQGHGAEKMHRCPSCDFSSNWPTGLRKHMKLHEEGSHAPALQDIVLEGSSGFSVDDDDFIPMSGASVDAAGDLIFQFSFPDSCKRKGRNGAMHFICDKCPLEDYNPHRFDRHYRRHGANLSYQCSQCDYSCTTKAGHQKHSALHDRAAARSAAEEFMGPPSMVPAVVSSTPSSTYESVIDSLLQATRDEILSQDAANRHSVSAAHMASVSAALAWSAAAMSSMPQVSSADSSYGLTFPPSPELQFAMIEGRNQLQCRVCGQQFKIARMLERHMVKFHADILAQHQRQLHPQTPSPQPQPASSPSIASADGNFYCDRCSYKTNHEVKYKLHLKAHGGHRPFSCGQCDFQAQSFDQLQQHQLMHGPLESPVLKFKNYMKCDHCPFATTTSSHMKAHRQAHTKGSGYKCPHCSYRSNFYGFLKKHIDLHELPQHHLGLDEALLASACPDSTPAKPKPARPQIATAPKTGAADSMRLPPKMKKCPFCPYKSLNNMDRHKKMHEGRRNHKCPYCTFSTDVLHALNYHKRLHGDMRATIELPERRPDKNELSCPYCPFRTYHSSTYKTHLSCHDSQGTFKCTQCTFTTDLEYHFTTHVNMHRRTDTDDTATPIPAKLPGKVFSCLKCPYQTTRKGDLYKHFVNHGRVALFRCKYCDYGMSSEHALQMHEHLHLQAQSASGIRQPPLPPPLSFNPPKREASPPLDFAKQAQVSSKCSELISLLSGAGATLTNDMYDLSKSAERPLSNLDSFKESTSEGIKLELPNCVEAGCFETMTAQGLVYRCSTCPFETPVDADIAAHLPHHGAEEDHKCPVCSFASSESAVLNQHLWLHDFPVTVPNSSPTARQNPFLCPQCPCRFKANSEMVRHQRKHGQNLPYACSYCTYSSETLPLMKSHIIVHKEYAESCEKVIETAGQASVEVSLDGSATTGRRYYKCGVCDLYSARQAKAVRRHLIGHRSYGSGPSCQKCRIATGSQNQRVLHRILHRKPSAGSSFAKPFRCFICGLHFCYWNQLRAHKLVLHASTRFDPTAPRSVSVNSTSASAVSTKRALPSTAVTKPMASTKMRQCPECPYRSVYLTDLKRHLKHHGRDEAFTCSMCTFSAKSRFSLTRHEKLHFQCGAKPVSLCLSNSPSSSVSDAADRMDVTKSSERVAEGRKSTTPVRLSTCSLCPYSTRHPYDMVAHMRMHEGERPFKCTLCSYNTERMSALHHHFRLHKTSYPTESVTPLISEPEITTPSTSVPNQRQQSPSPSASSAAVSSKLKVVVNKSGQEIGELMSRDGYRLYFCNACPYKTTLNTNLVSHSRLHFGRRPYQCPHCTFNTEVQRRLADHVQIHSGEADASGQSEGSSFHQIPTTSESVMFAPEPNGYRCQKCNHFATSYEMLCYHLQKHNQLAKFKCTECSFQTSILQLMRVHGRVHAEGYDASNGDDFTPEAFPIQLPAADNVRCISRKCSLCGYRAKSMSVLWWHRNTVHKKIKVASGAENGKEHRCPKCPFVAQSYGSWWYHVRMHVKKGIFQCPQCSFSTKIASAYYNHVILHEKSGKQNDVDSKLEKESASAEKIAAVGEKETTEPTVWAETNGEPQKVDEPNIEDIKSLLEKTATMPAVDLNFDVKVEPGSSKVQSRFTCKLCPHKSESLRFLRLHERMHKEKREFSCRECTFSASQQKTLANHMQWHGKTTDSSDDRSPAKNLEPPKRPLLTCPGCPYRTKVAERLAEHERYHNQPKSKHRCPDCSFRSDDSSVVKKHRILHLSNRSSNLASALGLTDPFKYYCPKCSFNCEFPTNYWKHLQMHGRQDGCMCSVCDYSSSRASVVRFHEQNHHTHVPLSSLIPVSGQPESDLGSTSLEPANHTSSIPDKTEPKIDPEVHGTYKCTLCDFEGDTVQALTGHIRFHADTLIDEVKRKVTPGVTDVDLFFQSLNLVPKT